MTHEDLKAIYNFLYREGYVTESDPTYFIRGNTAIDIFDDGLVLIWRKRNQEKIGEFSVNSYGSFIKKYRKLEGEKWGLT